MAKQQFALKEKHIIFALLMLVIGMLIKKLMDCRKRKVENVKGTMSVGDNYAVYPKKGGIRASWKRSKH